MLPRLSADDAQLRQGRFRLPYINGKYIVPLLFIAYVAFEYERIASGLTEIKGIETLLFLIFIVLGLVMSVLAFIRNLSLIPIMGVMFCSYLLIEIPALSWIYFFVWLVIGLVIYFSYGYWKSMLRRKS